MTNDEQVERVARAICEVTDPGDSWEDFGDHKWYFDLARAALAAMTPEPQIVTSADHLDSLSCALVDFWNPGMRPAMQVDNPDDRGEFLGAQSKWEEFTDEVMSTTEALIEALKETGLSLAPSPAPVSAVTHDEDTLRKVYDGLAAASIIGQQAMDAVCQMLNHGILFRERAGIPVEGGA